MSQESEIIRYRARAVKLNTLYFREEEFNPFLEKTPLGSPILPQAYLRQNQFREYMIRYLGEDSFMIDLFGKNGRVLHLTYLEFCNSRYKIVDASKHSSDQIFSQIYTFKTDASETFIKAVIDSRLGKSHSIVYNRNAFTYNFNLEGKSWEEKQEDYNELLTPSLEYRNHPVGSWTAALGNKHKGKVFAISSAFWYRYDELERLVDLFLNRDSMLTVLALKEPRWQEIATGPSWRIQPRK